MHTDATRTLGSFKLGEAVKVELRKQGKEAQRWAEVTKEELNEAVQEQALMERARVSFREGYFSAQGVNVGLELRW